MRWLRRGSAPADHGRIDVYYGTGWYDDRWNDLGPDLRSRCRAALVGVIPDDDKELIRRKHAEHGPHEWVHHLSEVEVDGQTYTFSAHHIWGTAIRNHLRHTVCPDDQLPAAPYHGGQAVKNWDDYYVQAVEAALGLRW